MNDFKDMNQLPSEVKILIVNAQTLVNKTREQMKERRCDIDLSGKMQLKEECRVIEKNIKAFKKGSVRQKDIDTLKISIIRLETAVKMLFEE